MEILNINPSCVSTVINDQTVILNIDTGKYYELNSTASIIWKMIDDGTPKDTIISKIQSDYSLSHSEASDEVKEFLEHCINSGFLIAN